MIGMLQKFFMPIIIFLFGFHGASAQELLKVDSLSIEEIILIAHRNSINAQIAVNDYVADYWSYLNYKKKSYPMLAFYSNPVQYVQKFVRRYDSQNNLDVYKPQKSIYSSMGFVVRQRVNATGGELFLETDFDYAKNFGSDQFQQFSTVPVRFGYSQELLGFNPYKWEKKLETKKNEKTRKKIVHEFEKISAETVKLCFAYLTASERVRIAQENCKKCDSIYSFAVEKKKIASMTQTENLTLKLNLVDAKKELRLLTIEREKAKEELLAFLNVNEDTNINIKIPLPEKQLLITPEKAIVVARENNPVYDDLALKRMNAEMTVDRAKKSNISSSLSLSLGYNQTASDFVGAYRKPLRQDLISVSFNMPIFDWGIRKRERAIAKKDLESTLLTIEQEKENFERHLCFLVEKFNESFKQIELASEALDISLVTFEATFERFRIGKSNVESLKISQDRLMSSELNYLNALSSYWNALYEIRSLTLYDFIKSDHIGIDVDQYVN